MAPAPWPRILPAASLQISLHIRRFPSSSRGAQTGPRHLAGGGQGEAQRLEPTSRFHPLCRVNHQEPLTFQHLRTAPSLYQDRQFSVSFPGAEEHLSLSRGTQGVVGYACKKSHQSSQKPSSAAGFVISVSAVSVHPTKTRLTQVPTPELPLQQRHIPKGEIHRPAVDGSKHHQQGLK